jgi:hypothetical protein
MDGSWTLDDDANDMRTACQVLAILYQGFQAAKEEPRLLGTVENEVRLLSCSAASTRR